jgi:hypothetical protein
MSTRHAGAQQSNGHKASSPEELRAQVERTRRELGETVGELAAKADVKAAAREKMARVGDRARHVAEDRRGDPRTYVAAALACALIGVSVLLRVRRHRRRGVRRM